jgi:hypothetical protein
LTGKGEISMLRIDKKRKNKYIPNVEFDLSGENL